MRSAWLLLFALAACGGSNDELNPGNNNNNNGMSGPSDNPNCASCYDTLVAETNLCGPALDACANNPTLDTPGYIACFRTEASCFDTALQKSASCNDACGDDEQAGLERCTASCFLMRGECAEVVLRAVDACLDQCSGPQCDGCTAEGQAQFDNCNLNLTNCSDACIRQFRGG